MAHLALYRKWRPQTFGDIIGQDETVQILKNAILQNRTAHANLFCGTRGCGKTTTARILAKALNCLNPVNGEPCNQCHNCKAITDGYYLDVVEIDAASNRNIENAKNLLEKVQFAPVEGQYKIYIIDEVHMLTTDAFNVLLKTLEEPPSHTIFILATTDPHRVPITIRSRCRRFDFKNINEDIINNELLEIAQKEGIELTEDARESIAIIAEKGNGSMRDALTLMDQVLTDGKIMSPDELNHLIGSVSYDFWPGFFRKIKEHRIKEVFQAIDDMYREGKDMLRFFGDFRACIGDCLTVNDNTPGKYGSVLRECSDIFTPEETINIIGICGNAENIIRYNHKDKELCRFFMAEILKNIGQTGTEFPEAIKKPAPTVIPEPQKQTKDIPKAEKSPDLPPWEEEIKPEQPVKAEVKKENNITAAKTENSNEPVDKVSVSDNKDKLRADILKAILKENRQTYTWLNYGKLTDINDEAVTFTYDSHDKDPYQRIMEPQHQKIAKAAIEKVCGKSLRLIVHLQSSAQQELRLF